MLSFTPVLHKIWWYHSSLKKLIYVPSVIPIPFSLRTFEKNLSKNLYFNLLSRYVFISQRSHLHDLYIIKLAHGLELVRNSVFDMTKIFHMN